MNWNRIVVFLVVQAFAALPLLANQEAQFQKRVNLALRQAGHCLLVAQGDSTSTIPPVYYEEEQGFILPIHGAFNYDTLPYLLQEAFVDYAISGDYNVMVKNCDSDILFLGYNKAAFDRGHIPCLGREQKETCANIVVEFIPSKAAIPTPNSPKKTVRLAWLLLPIVAGGLLLLFRQKTDKPIEAVDNGQLQLGQYYYDPKNQLLTYGEEKFTLTFRENKLLHLFATKPNEILNRAEILAAVWEEEGVIVGRSLDVFISRLRKLLKQDPSVQIKNIHGVGYRLELPTSASV